MKIKNYLKKALKYVEIPNEGEGWLMDKLNQIKLYYKNGVIANSNNSPSLIFYGTEVYYNKYGEIHRKNGPAIKKICGTIIYVKNNIVTKKIGPAVITCKGHKKFYYKGKKTQKNIPFIEEIDELPNGFYSLDNLSHRTDGPAQNFINGTKIWCLYGNIHRLNKPAVIKANGYKGYYFYGFKHRFDGPAVIHQDGKEEYWIFDKEFSSNEYLKILKIEWIDWLPNYYKNNKKFILEILKYCKIRDFEFIDYRLRKNKKIALKAMKINVLNITYCSEKFTDNKEMIIKCIKYGAKQNNFNFLYYISDRLKNDKEIAMLTVKTNGCSLNKFSENIRSNKEIIIEAIKQDPFAMIYISDKIKNNSEFIIHCIQNYNVYPYLPSKISQVKKFVLAAIKIKGDYFQNLPYGLQNDKEIALEAIKKDGLNISYISKKKLRNDKEIALTAIRENGSTIQYLKSKFRNDKNIALEVVKQDGYYIQYLEPKLAIDEDIIIEALRKNNDVLKIKMTIFNKINGNLILKIIKSNVLKDLKKVLITFFMCFNKLRNCPFPFPNLCFEEIISNFKLRDLIIPKKRKINKSLKSNKRRKLK